MKAVELRPWAHPTWRTFQNISLSSLGGELILIGNVVFFPFNFPLHLLMALSSLSLLCCVYPWSLLISPFVLFAIST